MSSHARSHGHDASSTSSRRRSATEAGGYDVPPDYSNIDDIELEPPIQNTSSSHGLRRLSTRDTRRSSLASFSKSRSKERERPHRDSTASYGIPDDYANLGEVAATATVENPAESPVYQHRTLEQVRSGGHSYQEERRRRQEHGHGDDVEGPTSPSPPLAASTEKDEPQQNEVSKHVTQLYTVSYLIFFSFLGTMARVGLSAITSYRNTPVIFPTIWANFGGCVVMGFLAEDRMLFRHEWGIPTYDQLVQAARQREQDEEDATGPLSTAEEEAIDLAAAKKAYTSTKKTIPLYIGLTTGFCGSFTSFSAFIRDVFLALSNNLYAQGGSPVPRNGGYSFEAMLAVVIITICLPLSGLFLGAHLALASERFVPSVPYPLTRRIIDPLVVFLAWGCWLGAVLLAIWPPHDDWRGLIVFSLVFAPLGCLGRFYLALHLNGRMAAFPLGTFAANVLGTGVLGMVYDFQHIPFGAVVGCQVLQGVEDGFCGCLTTISTWMAELSSLTRRNSYIYGTTSVVVSLLLLIAIMGGLRWDEGFSQLQCRVP